MQLHELKRKTKTKSKKRVGRGGLRGKTSGRGHKGQNARAGHRVRPEIRDMIKKLPKLRGHGVNRSRTVNSSVVKPTPINLTVLEENFSNGDKVNPKVLVSVGLVDKKKGKLPKVKILGVGTLSKKLEVSNCAISESAKAQVEKAGGKVEVEV
jgi:large subunit ribosomal protein L15